MVARPQPEEFTGFESSYVARVPDGADVFEVLRGQSDQLQAILQNVWNDQAGRRPRPGQWSIKEVIGHIADQERIFAYRLLCIARGDKTPLPGYDQEAYVDGTDLNARSLAGLVEEFDRQRRANLLCFEALDEDEFTRVGTANDSLVTPRALLYLMAGHVMHHLESLQVDYNVGG
nr:J548 [uncultured bacterium]